LEAVKGAGFVTTRLTTSVLLHFAASPSGVNYRKFLDMCLEVEGDRAPTSRTRDAPEGKLADSGGATASKPPRSFDISTALATTLRKKLEEGSG
jgi:hypothetical protein